MFSKPLIEIIDQIQISISQKSRVVQAWFFVPDMIHISTLTYLKITPRFSALFELYHVF